LKPVLDIFSFSPESGWPGTIIEISGGGFSENRDDNYVKVGGETALVIDASADRLKVLASEFTRSGPVSVTVGSSLVETSTEFKVLPEPSPDSLPQTGAPRFFHGPQDGTPQTNVQNQPVLVLVTYPTDRNPGNAANRAALRNDLINRIDQASQYWKEASYGSTTWNMTYTDWIALPQERRFYAWQVQDIEDARRALLIHTNRSLAFDGTRIFHGTSTTGWIPVNHPNPTTFTILPAINMGGWRTTALHLVGNRLYAGAEDGRVVVYDVTNINAPSSLGSILLPGGDINAIDVSGRHSLG
jgi:hypothetical protein